MHMIERQQPTVVLLHSSASSARQWDRLAEALKPNFDVRTIEFYGHGKQPAWHGNAPMTLADEAALAVPAIEEAGGAHVVGHSYGGAVALKLATMHPQLVRSVLVYEPVLFRLALEDFASDSAVREIVDVADMMQEQLATGHANLAAKTFVDLWSGAGAWASLPVEKQTSIAARMHAVGHHFDALFHEPLQQSELVRLRMPTMLVSGSRSPAVTRRIAEILRLALVAPERYVAAAMGHMGPITHSAEFNRLVVRFLHAQHGYVSSTREVLGEAA